MTADRRVRPQPDGGRPFHVILAFAAAAGGAALLAVFALRGLRKAEAAG